ncbi:MAG: HAMP domain-containing histidine kinase, partial [Gordonia polyisoprenivorans]|nr:HAMP domain-containing histidine kinase [Gordonia polyisoprenivorans]
FDDLARQLADSSARLAAARTEIERMDAARRQFFAWISHDLRTPLAGMRAMAEALEDGRASDPAGYVRQMRAKVDTVDRMVDDLFELSRLQSDAVLPVREPVDLLDVVSDAVADVRPLATARGIRIVQEGIAGCVLDADPRELARVVGNLLSNAVRHTPDDSEVLVSGRLDGGTVTLAVVDRGAGVADADLGRMFDVGWRGDPARTIDGASGAGAGLGLAIVRGIVEAHGGSVRAAHRPEGFCVELTLPAATPHPV